MVTDRDTTETRVARSEEHLPPIIPGRLRRGLSHVPTFVVALVLLLPILLIDHFDVLRSIRWYCYGARESVTIRLLVLAVLFIPGAVKQWNWRHLVVMLTSCAVLLGVAWLLGSISTLVAARPRWPLAPLRWGAPFVVLGLIEALLDRRGRWLNLIWVCAGAVAAAAVVDGVTHYLSLTGWWVGLPGSYGTTYCSPAWLIDRPLAAVLIWLAVPACLRVAKSRSLAQRVVLGAAAAAAVAALLAFRGLLLFPMAERSLTGEGPFERGAAAWCLAGRGRDADIDLLWQQLETTGRSGPSARPQGVLPPHGDWHRIAIAAVSKRDPPGAARRLSQLLLSQPRLALARDAARLFAAHNRYETVPVLMRYALATYNGECIQALEAMGLPRAALPIMRDKVAWEARLLGRQLTHFELRTCQRLELLLGKNVGPEVQAWLQLYDRTISDRPTPLPGSIQDETDRVIRALVQYYVSSNDWAEATLWAARKKGASIEYARVLNRSVSEPNWDVTTTEELEREVAAYAERVRAAIDRHFPPQTRPAGQPPAGPEIKE